MLKDSDSVFTSMDLLLRPIISEYVSENSSKSKFGVVSTQAVTMAVDSQAETSPRPLGQCSKCHGQKHSQKQVGHGEEGSALIDPDYHPPSQKEQKDVGQRPEEAGQEGEGDLPPRTAGELQYPPIDYTSHRHPSGRCLT